MTCLMFSQYSAIQEYLASLMLPVLDATPGGGPVCRYTWFPRPNGDCFGLGKCSF